MAALIAAPACVRAEPPAVTWDAPIEVASGEAYQGPWRMNRSQFFFVDDPTLAIDDMGNVGVSWVDQSRKDVYFQLYGSDGVTRLREAINVSRTPTIFSWLPRMVLTPGTPGSVYILWQEIVFSGGSHGGEIFFARSRDGGRSFDAPLNLSNSEPGDGKGRLTRRYWDNGSLDIAMGPRGTLYAAWTEYDGALWFSRSTNAGESFTEPLRVAGEDTTQPARAPSLAADADDTVYLAWTVGENPRADIHVARSNDGGRSFGAPRIVSATGGHSDAPKIAVDGNRMVHLVHAESPEGPFNRYHVRYTRSDDGGNTFDEPRDITGSYRQRYESNAFPALAVDGAGTLFVLWELYSDRKARSRGLGLTLSTDAGETFAPPSRVPYTTDPPPGDNGSRQGLLMRKLAVNHAGAIAVVNSTFKSDQASRIWLVRGQCAPCAQRANRK